MGLIDLYLETGVPVGSAALKEHGFDDLSPATIRNYFAKLEEEGYLAQKHASGGRIPTALAFQAYADAHRSHTFVDPSDIQALKGIAKETKEIASYLHEAAETLAKTTNLAIFLSTPRFDHDFVLDIKLVPLDTKRVLAVLITDFGSVISEVLYADEKLSSFTLKRVEHYFTWRLTGHEMAEKLTTEEQEVASRFYNELMVRYVTRYSSFSEEELYRTGFSQLIHYPEFASASALANGLTLFESSAKMHAMLHECIEHGELRYWIGDALAPIVPSATHCSVVTIPYFIRSVPVGAIGLLGPMRIPYKQLFGLLSHFSDQVSTALTKNLYKYRISYRQPAQEKLYLPTSEQKFLKHD